MRRYQVRVGSENYEVELLRRAGSEIAFRLGEDEYEVDVSPLLGSATNHASAATVSTDPGRIEAPMPGIVVSVAVKKGDAVKAGDTLLVIEAMKMENNIAADISGTVGEVSVKAGEEVENGQLLISIA